MKNLMLLKENYQETFRGLGNKIERSYTRTLGWLVFVAYLFVIGALVFKVTTGFAY